LDLTAFTPGLPYNRTAGTRVYVAYLAALILLLIRAASSERTKLRHADPRLLLYFGCALFAVTMPRMKDYSYVLMLIPTLFVVRDIGRRGIAPEYFLFAVGLMIWGQPQQNYVPGMQALIYMLQAYLPLFMAATVMVYMMTVLLRTRDTSGSSRDQPVTVLQPARPPD
jgi:hypothetical protein